MWSDVTEGRGLAWDDVDRGIEIDCDVADAVGPEGADEAVRMSSSPSYSSSFLQVLSPSAIVVESAPKSSTLSISLIPLSSFVASA